MVTCRKDGPMQKADAEKVATAAAAVPLRNPRPTGRAVVALWYHPSLGPLRLQHWRPPQRHLQHQHRHNASPMVTCRKDGPMRKADAEKVATAAAAMSLPNPRPTGRAVVALWYHPSLGPPRHPQQGHRQRRHPQRRRRQRRHPQQGHPQLLLLQLHPARARGVDTMSKLAGTRPQRQDCNWERHLLRSGEILSEVALHSALVVLLVKHSMDMLWEVGTCNQKLSSPPWAILHTECTALSNARLQHRRPPQRQLQHQHRYMHPSRRLAPMNPARTVLRNNGKIQRSGEVEECDASHF